MKFGRSIAAVSVALGMGLLGATSAQAWTWASSSNPILMTGGGGYGNANQSSYNTGVLQSWLKDTALDGERVYVNMYADYGSADFRVESGRRSDGGSSYARMADKSFTSTYPYGVAQYYYTVRLCRDKAYSSDPCSDAYRTHQGL
jgi:hypothetical protein